MIEDWQESRQDYKDIQLDEIAKLPKGVAVVYQNDWIEPVLCKVDKFRGEERIYKKRTEVIISSCNEKKQILIHHEALVMKYDYLE